MTSQGHHRDLSGSHHQETGQPVDFTFFDTQTDGDLALQLEVLELFLAQARRLIPTLPGLSADAQADVAHLLKGSARGIGAWVLADEAGVYETGDISARPTLWRRLLAAFADAETEITIRVKEIRATGTASVAPSRATI